MLDPGVQFKAVERDALSTNWDFREACPDFRVEAITVHTQVTRGIAETEEPRGDIGLSLHARIGISDQDKSLSRPPFHARVRD